MQPKNPLFQKCLTYLATLPNIKATIQGESYFSSEVLADGQLTISTSNETTNYICEIKTGLTNDLVEQVSEYFANLGKRLEIGQRPLLITRNLSSLVVDQLLDKNIEFIDVDGNIYLNSPEIYIVVRNQASKESTNKSLEITAAALQVMYVLLNQPELFAMGDSVDEKILKLLEKRFLFTDEIGKIKKQEKIKVVDKNRETEILFKYKKISEKLKLNKKFTENILKLILQESKKRQK
jgi:chorismate mutase